MLTCANCAKHIPSDKDSLRPYIFRFHLWGATWFFCSRACREQWKREQAANTG